MFNFFFETAWVDNTAMSQLALLKDGNISCTWEQFLTVIDEWMNEWMNQSVIDWMTDWLTDWLNESVFVRFNESVSYEYNINLLLIIWHSDGRKCSFFHSSAPPPPFSLSPSQSLPLPPHFIRLYLCICDINQTSWNFTNSKLNSCRPTCVCSQFAFAIFLFVSFFFFFSLSCGLFVSLFRLLFISSMFYIVIDVVTIIPMLMN